MCPPGFSSQHAHITDATRKPVGIEALEEELRVSPPRSHEVTEAGQRDLAGGSTLGEQNVLCYVERVDADRIAVAEPNEAPTCFEEAGDLLVRRRARTSSAQTSAGTEIPGSNGSAPAIRSRRSAS